MPPYVAMALSVFTKHIDDVRTVATADRFNQDDFTDRGAILINENRRIAFR